MSSIEEEQVKMAPSLPQPPPSPPVAPTPPAPPVPPAVPVPPTVPTSTDTNKGGRHPHHISDIDTWKHPDRSYFVFVILSVCFGLFGADHFYLRSYHTGMLKFLSNISGFGIWYFWDLIQIIYDGKKVREEGLSSPFDWVCGIGRGVILPASEKNPKFVAEKSYLLYTILAVFFGFLGVDKMYMGHFWQGLAKVFSVFNIFLFLFGFIWVLWDSFHALFMTKSILENGITPPLPYSFFFTEPIDGKLFLVDNPAETTKTGGLGDIIPTVPIPTFSYSAIYKDIVAPLMTPPVVKAITIARSGQIPEIPTSLDMPTMPGLATLPTMPTMPTIPSVANVKAAATQAASQAVSQATQAATNAASHATRAATQAATQAASQATQAATNAATQAIAPTVQTGGARYEQISGPGPAIAGVLTAVVVAGGLKGFYDIISSQYG